MHESRLIQMTEGINKWGRRDKSHAKDLQRRYADPVPSRRVTVTPHASGLIFFQSAQPGREGGESSFTVETAGRPQPGDQGQHQVYVMWMVWELDVMTGSLSLSLPPTKPQPLSNQEKGIRQIS